MTVDQLIALVKEVLLTPEVIGVTIVIVLFINIVNYIVSYRKPAPRSKKKPVRAPAPEKAGPTAAERAGHAPPEDEEEEEEKAPPPKSKGKRK